MKVRAVLPYLTAVADDGNIMEIVFPVLNVKIQNQGTVLANVKAKG